MSERTESEERESAPAPSIGLGRIVKAYGYSLEGLAGAWRTQGAFRQEALVALVALPIACLAPVSLLETALLLASFLLVMIVELLNSAVEVAIDRISPERHPLSKLAKDMGSAAVLLSIVVAVLVWSAILMPKAWAAERPENFILWRDGLASSAQPTAAWLATVGGQKYDLVINLAPPQSHGSIAQEGAIVEAQGVKYVNIPVDFMRPAAADFSQFSDLMKANSGSRVFVHCQANFRGSSFVFLYRVLHEGAAAEEELRKLQGVWVPEPQWKRFIQETLKANGRSVELL
jgi:diacylglycerol kinase (ATP)